MISKLQGFAWCPVAHTPTRDLDLQYAADDDFCVAVLAVVGTSSREKLSQAVEKIPDTTNMETLCT